MLACLFAHLTIMLERVTLVTLVLVILVILVLTSEGCEKFPGKRPLYRLSNDIVVDEKKGHIPSISLMLLQEWCHWVHYPKRQQMSLNSLC